MTNLAEMTKKQLLDQSRIVSFLLEVRRTKILEFLLENTTVKHSDTPIEKQAA